MITIKRMDEDKPPTLKDVSVGDVFTDSNNRTYLMLESHRVAELSPTPGRYFTVGELGGSFMSVTIYKNCDLTLRK